MSTKKSKFPNFFNKIAIIDNDANSVYWYVGLTPRSSFAWLDACNKMPKTELLHCIHILCDPTVLERIFVEM